jgi:hypothetical protein
VGREESGKDKRQVEGGQDRKNRNGRASEGLSGSRRTEGWTDKNKQPGRNGGKGEEGECKVSEKMVKKAKDWRNWRADGATLLAIRRTYPPFRFSTKTHLLPTPSLSPQDLPFRCAFSILSPLPSSHPPRSRLGMSGGSVPPWRVGCGERGANGLWGCV